MSTKYHLLLQNLLQLQEMTSHSQKVIYIHVYPLKTSQYLGATLSEHLICVERSASYNWTELSLQILLPAARVYRNKEQGGRKIIREKRHQAWGWIADALKAEVATGNTLTSPFDLG